MAQLEHTTYKKFNTVDYLLSVKVRADLLLSCSRLRQLPFTAEVHIGQPAHVRHGPLKAGWVLVVRKTAAIRDKCITTVYVFS